MSVPLHHDVSSPKIQFAYTQLNGELVLYLKHPLSTLFLAKEILQLKRSYVLLEVKSSENGKRVRVGDIS